MSHERRRSRSSEQLIADTRHWHTEDQLLTPSPATLLDKHIHLSLAGHVEIEMHEKSTPPTRVEFSGPRCSANKSGNTRDGYWPLRALLTFTKNICWAEGTPQVGSIPFSHSKQAVNPFSEDPVAFHARPRSPPLKSSRNMYPTLEKVSSF